MRLHRLLVLAPAAAAALASPAGAQTPRAEVYAAPRTYRFDREDRPRAVLGLTPAPSGGRRDTLGLLVAMVAPGGPAERAGIEEGNRLVAINGASLRVPAADAEDYERVGFAGRRLTRELNKVKPGDEVELRVYGGGQTRSVRVRTADADSLDEAMRPRRRADDRASIGVGIGSAGSARDSLGVLVMSVADSGPAARAGIEEGNRIAAINGVDLRVSREDLGDEFVAGARARRLQRELAKLKAGDDVELRVYANGQFRTMRLKAVKASDLPRRRGNVFMFGDPGGFGPMPPMAPMPPMPPMELGPDRARLRTLRLPRVPFGEMLEMND